MRSLLGLSLRSLWNRRLTVGLTILSLAVSVTLLLGVEKLRQEARTGFLQTISGTDLIVGARSGPVQLLLYSVFHLGSATNNISWQSYQTIAGNRLVEWAVPLSLGDSHRGYRVVGTTADFFARYRYAGSRSLRFAGGEPFDGVYDAVLGAEVADRLGYALGREIVLSHGLGRSFLNHADKPFTVVGVLARTGTPLDRSVLVSLEGIEAIHIDWQQGRPPTPRERIDAQAVLEKDLTPETVTAVLVGLKSRIATFQMQRAINEYRQEPLTAILPGVALAELWRVVGVVERALLAIAAFVVLAGLIGMTTMLLASLNERRREMAILRAVGARPLHVFALFLLEALAVGLVACALGLAAVYGGLWLGADLIQTRAGLQVGLSAPGTGEWLIVGLILLAVLLAGCIPAWRAYALSLSDGLSIRA
jgi:putative ABC transport system permease protein